MIKKGLILVLALALCAGTMLMFTSCGGGGGGGDGDSDVREMKFSAMAVEGDVTFDICQNIVDEINEKSDTVHVTFYPADVLGDYTVVWDEVMHGTIDMAHSAYVDTYSPLATCAIIPYLVTDYSDLEAVFGVDSFIYKTTAKACEEIDLEYLGTAMDGLAGITTTKKVENADDPTKDKGVIIRAPANLTSKLAAQGLGFRTTVIPFSDTFSAMQSGVVDGCVAAPPGGTYLTFRDVMKYWYEYRCYAEATGFIFSKKVMDELSEEDQTIIREAFAKGTSESFKASEDFNNKYMQIMKDEGIEVIDFTDAQYEVFKNHARENYWPKLYDMFGEEFFDELKTELDKSGL